MIERVLSSKNYFQITGVIFTFVAAVHLYRLFSGMPIMLGDWNAPMWVSILGFVVAGFLAYSAFSTGKKKR